MEPIPSQPPSAPLPQNEPDPVNTMHPAGQVIAPSGIVVSEPPAPPAAAPEPEAPPGRPVVIGSGPIISAETYTNSPPEIISANSQPAKRRLLKKPVLIAGLTTLVLLGGSAAAYFGYYVPNKPQNVWSRALVNTGKGYDKLAEYSQNQFGAKAGGVSLKGSYKITGLAVADGTFEGKSDSSNGEFTGSLSASGVKVNLDTRIIKSASGSPDIYFKIDGLKGIGTLFSGAGSQYEKALNGIDGSWYFIDHTLFDQYASGANSSLQITQDDVHSVLKAVGDASKQNVFTNDPAKMAFSVKQNIGKEKQDGRNVYHYKAAVNKENLKQYVSALCDNLKNSNLKKFFNGDSKQVTSALGCDTANTAVANFDDKRTADVWVDLRTKLIHKVRFTDTNNKDNYFDVGQDYQGGDNFPFNLSFHSKSSGTTTTGDINLGLNMKTNTLNVKGSVKDNGADNLGGSLDFSVSPNSSKVNVEKPANAKTLIQLLNDFGFSDFFSGAGTGSNAADTERKTEINALHGQIEAYDAQNGFYPMLANINDPAFRAKNFAGLDAATLQDPSGSTAKLGASPAAHIYSYQALPAGCDNLKTKCTDYTLTATLDSGGTYVKQALNFDPGLPTTLN